MTGKLLHEEQSQKCPVKLYSFLGEVRCTQEIPLLVSKDGKYIEMHRTFYGEDCVKYTITGLGCDYVWGRKDGSRTDKRLRPEWLTSKYPDSWEQLQSDITLQTGQDIARDIIRRAKALAHKVD